MSVIDRGPETSAKFDRTEAQRKERTTIITWALRKGAGSAEAATQLADDIMLRRLQRAIGTATKARAQEILQEEVFLPGFQPDEKAATVRAEADVIAGMEAFDAAMPLPDYQALAGLLVANTTETVSLDDFMREVRQGVPGQPVSGTVNIQPDLRPGAGPNL